MKDNQILLIYIIVLIVLVSLAVLVPMSMKNKNNQTLQAVLSPTGRESLILENPNAVYNSMPWTNCMGENRKYCTSNLTRMPGGCMKMQYYPRCNMSCNAGCPGSCSRCVEGSCQK